jgi:uncharacterized protein (DUF2267 family)
MDQCSRFVLNCVVRRLHYRDAARLIEALPEPLREELLDLPAGPDVTITLYAIVSALIRRMELTEPQAQVALAKFWSWLGETVEPELQEQIRATLHGDQARLAA